MNELIYVVYTLGYDSRVEIHKNRKYSQWGVFNNLKSLKMFIQYLVNTSPSISYFKIRLPDNKIMSAVTFCEIFHIEKQSFPERKKGRWNGYNADNPEWLRDDGNPIFLSCSECNGTVLNNGSAHWNFCPNCGSLNGGEEECMKTQ